MTTNSGQAVLGATQNVEYAGFWARFAAFFLDLAIIMILSLMIGIGASFAGGVAAVIGSVVIFIINLLYFPAMESSARQATFGKSLCGIKVTDMDGRRLSFLQALLRNIAKILSAIPLNIGFLLAAFTKRKQALHDMLAKCLVVRTGPSHLLKTVAMAIGGLVIAVGSGGAYFYYVYLPQMKNEFTGVMQEAAKGTFTAQTPHVAKVAPPAPAMPAAPKPVSTDATFDSLLGPALTGLEKPGTTRAGPAILELSKIMGDSVWVYVHLPLFKGDIAPTAEITVNKVLDASGQNYYDGASNLEKEFFLSPPLGRDSHPIPHLSGLRMVHIKPGLNEQALQKIEGQVRIIFPLELKPVTFEAGDVGKEKPVGDAVVTLKSLSGANAALHYRGDSTNLLEVRGYGKDGGLVKQESAVTMTMDDKTAEKQTHFKGPVSKVEVPIANKIERQFPFTLVRGAMAGSPSPATVDTKPLVLVPPAAAPAPTILAPGARLMTPEELKEFQAELAKSTKGGKWIADSRQADQKTSSTISSSHWEPDAPPSGKNTSAEAKQQQPVKESAAQSPAATNGMDIKAKSQPVMRARMDKSAASPVAAADVAAPEPQKKVVTPKFNDVFTAVMHQDMAAVKELLDLGWWVDKPEPSGYTPLMAAVEVGDTAIAELLLKHGANPNAVARSDSALKLARRNHNAEMVALLQRYGARME